MKKLGVSVFTGMDQSVEQNIEYLKLARSLHYAKLFTSLHIPEADYRSFLIDCRRVLDMAMNLGFEITADVAPQSWTLLGINPSALYTWGIHTIRTDYGFSPDKIRDLAEESGLMVEVNASSTTEDELNALLSSGMDRKKLRAGHNYYPRPETGLSFDLFISRSQCFLSREIPVSAFISDKFHSRGPIYAGLPTVENHRRMPSVKAARQLWTTGMVESILFGDPLVSEQELAAVAGLSNEVPELLDLRVAACDPANEVKSILWAPKHTNRVDAAGYVVRSQESRGLCCRTIIPQAHPPARRRGDVTIDNCKYGRYAGELQIVLQALPSDERVNIVGRVVDEDLFLLDCLLPGRAFRIKEA